MLHRKLIATACAVTLLAPPVHAEGYSLLSQSNDDVYRSRISEYFYMRTGKEVLKPIRLLGRVDKPGLYHVPADTSLVSLLALSGGVQNDADVKGILISRGDGRVEKKNLNDLIRVGGDLSLKDGDVVFVPKDEPLVSDHNTSLLIALTSILSVGLTAIVVFREK
ncbi:MAG: polysaccharide biosynthesis/export family protein [Bdellovibrionales bacterium]